MISVGEIGVHCVQPKRRRDFGRFAMTAADGGISSGQEKINKLNAQVKRKLNQAVEQAKKDGTPLDVVYAITMKPMEMGGLWAGGPIYVRRPVWPSFVIGAAGMFCAAVGAYDVGFFPTLLCIVVMLLW